ncbi:multifunctional CCA addition/repair protein [Halorhodospira halochloris]|uniref:multifunctional CCA addition/repair protein n=1 Tax=Halorhodospira halochloris TaxID=1052 RepID=UPI001EE9225C|nr:multifunctional CCA addition/repair protein [Halorhodospira halochloris]MCG5548986.1 multifunctional CCA addition/repair protein [Halorhodospira halochloris]
MDIYRVGGSVRDELLGLDVKERDWVVVGATAEQLEDAGYRRVGKDFPVFLHPQTGEEYALARTERKTAAGYHGFEVHACPDVTLEEDLARRDLTINAMAIDSDGQLIDPYGGREDLAKRQLRHVTQAFAEDPLRILRLARFAARFAKLGFRIAPQTMELCRRMVDAGEADALVPERVWQELSRGLMEPSPQRMIEVLRECGALEKVLIEVDDLYGIPQRSDYHPEGDAAKHTLLALEVAANHGMPLAVRYAVLLHDSGKAQTPCAELPSHPEHDVRGEQLSEAASERLRVPRECRDVARIVARYHLHAHRALQLRPGTIVELLERLDAFRRPQRFEYFLLACKADYLGREGVASHAEYRQGVLLRRALDAAQEITAKEFVERGMRGPEVGEAVRQARCQAVAELL